MKYNFILLLFLSVAISAQKSSDKFIKGELVLEGCEDSENKIDCLKNKLAQKFLAHITKNEIDELGSPMDTSKVVIKTGFIVDESGKPITRSITLNIKDSLDIFTKMKQLITELKFSENPVDHYNQNVAEQISVNLYFDKQHANDAELPLIYEAEYIPAEIPFAVIEKVPKYPGCRGKDNKKLKECMSNKISKHLSRNFNKNIAIELGLPGGTQRIFVSFKIDKSGDVVNVRGRASHPAFEEEAIRVVELLPKMKPGMQRGEPVGVLYSLPIVFAIDAPPKSKNEDKNTNKIKPRYN